MSEKPASAEFNRFVASINSSDPDYRETLDLDALLALEGDEREAAGELLIERVKVEDDWRVPPALAALRLKRSVRPMNDRLPEARGRMKLSLARALVELGALERIDETVIELLETGDEADGTAALTASYELKSKELIKALAHAAVHHPVPEVRINAGSLILYISKVSDDPAVWKFRPLYLLLGEEDEKERREAFEKICELARLPPELAS